MNINYGLIPKVTVKKYKNKKEKKEISRRNIAAKAIKEIKLWQNNFITKF
jgi:folate-dependent tRNA-U54 methylase TrmFO/GidA